MDYKEAADQVSAKLGISPETVREAYRMYWKYIRETLSALPLKKDLSEEEFSKLRTGFNIPSIGKIACCYDRYKAVKDRFRIAKSIREGKGNGNNKECETDV